MPESAASEGGDRRSGSPEIRFESVLRGPPDPRVSSLAGGARYKAMSPARLPVTRLPFLTIPPGFSPSALLESPVLLTNIKAEPSPTTGTFFMPSVVSKTVASDTSPSPRNTPDRSAFGYGSSGDFEFKPHVKPSLNSGFPSLGTLTFVDTKQHEHKPSVQIQNQNQPHILESSQMVKAENTVISSHALSLSVVNPASEPFVLDTISRTEVSIDELQQAKDLEDTHAPLSNHNESTSLIVAEKSSEDGYNWRKYGQKHVKGSEFPRSYYKCTHPNCQMKKQLERSHDGQVTEIMYKGQHDHPKPQPSRRLAVGAIISGPGEERSDEFSSLVSAAGKSSSAHGNACHQIDPNGIQELSPLSVSDDDAETGGGQPNHANGVPDDDDPESKRRKKDAACIDATSLGKANREPRVVVQTVSEVDILDDGYRWRKYGQKVVKGNPNPRSYYKCTNAGCPVRKHVERASHDPKAVITTYEGKHNHDVPAARTTGHDTSTLTNIGGSNALHSRMSSSLSSMLIKTCDMRPARNHYAQPAESNIISLDLGVGITSNQGNTASDKQHAPEIDQNHQAHFSSSDYNKGAMQAMPLVLVSTVGNSGNSLYGSREDKGEGFLSILNR